MRRRNSKKTTATNTPSPGRSTKKTSSPPGVVKPPKEIGGTQGPEPTRYGDWEHNGRCSDF